MCLPPLSKEKKGKKKRRKSYQQEDCRDDNETNPSHFPDDVDEDECRRPFYRNPETTMTISFQQKIRKKKVRFFDNSEDNQYQYTNDQVTIETFLDPTLRYSSSMTREEKKQRWYQRRELSSFWLSASNISKKIQLSHRQNGAASYEDPCSYTNVMRRVFDASNHQVGHQFSTNYDYYSDFGCLPHIHHSDLKLLEYFCSKWNVRGIERGSIPALVKCKRTTVRAVLHTQKEISMRTDMTNEEKTDVIYRISEMHSRPSRLFSQALGVADSIVSREQIFYHSLSYGSDEDTQKAYFEPPLKRQRRLESYGGTPNRRSLYHS